MRRWGLDGRGKGAHGEGAFKLLTLLMYQGSIWALAVTSDSVHAISGASDCTLKLWHLDSGQQIFKLKGHTKTIRCVALTPDGPCAVSASEDRPLKVRDLEEAASHARCQVTPAT